jgi:hypothetical protein
MVDRLTQIIGGFQLQMGIAMVAAVTANNVKPLHPQVEFSGIDVQHHITPF